MRVISATLAPLPPSRSRISRDPSAKSYTHCVPTAVTIGGTLTRPCRAQADVGVVLHRFGDAALGRPQRRCRGLRRVRERRPQGGRQEAVALLSQGEGARLAGAADDAARGAREADEVLALPARGAARQLRGQAGGQQQLEAERELVGERRVVPGVLLQQPELV